MFCADFSEAKSIFVLFAHLHDNKDVANGIFEICDIDEDVKNDGVDWIGDKELMKFVMVAYCILFHFML